ncbi:hypothetical protein [Pseudomonas antarctica]|uniref:hypothetical protein n=1 Tax=Pseudomonas antarctica TaxID=219572 RepID=UPI00387B02F3
MLITHADFATNAKINTGSDTPVESHRSSDLNFFQAEMSKTDQPDKRSPRAVASTDSVWGASESSATSTRLSKGFRDASKNKRMSELPQLLAESHVNVISQVKVVGAIAKACDKISTMG